MPPGMRSRDLGRDFCEGGWCRDPVLLTLRSACQVEVENAVSSWCEEVHGKQLWVEMTWSHRNAAVGCHLSGP